MTGPVSRGLSNLQSNHMISIADGARMIASYRSRSPSGIRAWLFDRGAIDGILGQSGCAGLRIYRAVKDDGTETVVLVGTDELGSDLGTASTSGTGLVAEVAWPCPPVCGATSALNPS